MLRQLSLEVLVGPAERRRALRRDIERGLSAPNKHIPPVWFYDEAGSLLFEEITRLPEYYPTRAERAILDRHAFEVVEAAAADTLVEIGSGTSEKTRLLLDAMATAGSLERIVLFDISRDVLLPAAEELGRTYGVDVHAIVGDFWHDLGAIPPQGRQLWAFLGGTIGNLRPQERRRLLERFRQQMGGAGHLLLGTDLVKESRRLLAAYDDSAGVTAAFNRNVLNVVNRELGGGFEPESFDHRAVWDPRQSWIEMRLRARKAQQVAIEEMALVVELAEGEEILTEISAKFTPDSVREELQGAGFSPAALWRDDAGDFQLTLASVPT